jgi:hypothetical protein
MVSCSTTVNQPAPSGPPLPPGYKAPIKRLDAPKYAGFARRAESARPAPAVKRLPARRTAAPKYAGLILGDEVDPTSNPLPPALYSRIVTNDARKVTVAWDGSCTNPSYYCVRYGPAGEVMSTNVEPAYLDDCGVVHPIRTNVYCGAYTNRVDCYTNTTATITNLVPSVTYAFVAQRYLADGQESLYSNEVLYTPPALIKVFVVRTLSSENLDGPFVLMTNVPPINIIGPTNNLFLKQDISIEYR